MWQLFGMIYGMSATVIIGCCMIALMVVNDFYTGGQMIAATVVGAVVSVPISWVIAKKIYAMTQNPEV